MRSISWVLLLVVAFSLSAFAQKEEKLDVQSVDEYTTVQRNLIQTAVTVNSQGSPFEGQFDTLLVAILAADPIVFGALSTPFEFTVFAPTDAAFAELGLTPSNVGTLDPSLLSSILRYHVIVGERRAAQVLSAPRFRTLQGRFIFPSATPAPSIRDTQGRVANIIATDVLAGNGVIHAIDKVILPFSL